MSSAAHIAETERLLVGSCLAFPERLGLASVLPGDFFNPRLGRIWGAMQGLVRDGVVPDVAVLMDKVEDFGLLAELAESGIASPNVAHLGRAVKEAAITREVKVVLGELLQSDSSGPELVAEATAALAQIAIPQQVGGETVQDGLVSMMDDIDRMENGLAVSGLSTGLADLDNRTGGIPYGVMTVIAGRPQSGKSALALQICRHVADQLQRNVDYWSLEDSRKNVRKRLVAQEAQVNLRKLVWGGLSSAEYKRVAQAAGVISRFGSRLWVGDTLPFHADQFALEVERQALKRKSALIVLDFIQLLRQPGFRNRNEELTAISLRLKAIPKVTGAALVVLSQLSREAEREDRPKLHHLRDCGSIEQDAHVIHLLSKPSWLVDDDDKPLPIVLDYIDKNKDAGPASCALHFHGPHVRYGDLPGSLREEYQIAVNRRSSKAKNRRR